MPEAYRGNIETESDGLLLIEASRRGLIPICTRRLNKVEQNYISPGSTFIYNKGMSRITRWTDGRSWSPSRIKKKFFTYNEIVSINKSKGKSKDKFDYSPLVKRTINVSVQGETYQVVNYRSSDPTYNKVLQNPSNDPLFIFNTLNDKICNYKENKPSQISSNLETPNSEAYFGSTYNSSEDSNCWHENENKKSSDWTHFRELLFLHKKVYNSTNESKLDQSCFDEPNTFNSKPEVSFYNFKCSEDLRQLGLFKI